MIVEPAWLGYAALVLVIAGSFAARFEALRLALVAAAALAAPAVWLAGNPAGAALLALVLVANAWRLWRDGTAPTGMRFSDEDKALRAQHFDGLSAGAARTLIDQGHWISARRGEILIRENEAAPSLFYLHSGAATIERDGHPVGRIADGELIGEATVLDGAQATATVQLASNARLWFVPAEALRRFLAANPDTARTLHEGFARALRGKLSSANARIAELSPLD